MGILISCLNIAKSQYKNSPPSQTTTKIPGAQTSTPVPAPSPQEQPPSLDPTPVPVREGLVVEHLATSPPPIPTPIEGEADKNYKAGSSGVTPVQGLGSATSTTTQTGGKEDKDTAAGTMATDEDYMSFLDKANQDPNEGVAKAQGSGKGLPDEATFAKLINHPKPKDADIQIMDVGEWDTQGQYKDVVEATREAVKGSDVRVYRVVKDGSRVEYWVVGVEGGELVGVKALAVES